MRRLTAAALAAAAALCPAVPAAAQTRTDPMETCEAVRRQTTFDPRDQVNLRISDSDKRPVTYVSFSPGDVFMAVAQPSGWISTSPGQAFLGNGTWGPGGNGTPAGDDWLLPQRSEFGVSLRIAATKVFVGTRSPCVRWPGGLVAMPVEFGLNVVQQGWGSPLTNRWEGSIGVRFIHFPA
jgi:hypothetical protein